MRPTAEELRVQLAAHDEAEKTRRAEADADRARLVAEVKEAEHRERVEEARRDLLAAAADHEREADRLDALADERDERLAVIDAELAGLLQRQASLRASNAADTDRAQAALLADAEEAGRLAVAIHGRETALQGLEALVAAARERRAAIAVEAAPVRHGPGGELLLGARGQPTLREAAEDGRGRAAHLHKAAKEDPLGEGVAASTATWTKARPAVAVAETGRPLTPSEAPAALGYGAGTIGAVAAGPRPEPANVYDYIRATRRRRR